MQNRGSYNRSWLIYRGSDHSAVSDRAERTFVTGELGIVSVDVDGLGEAAQCDKKDSQKRQRSGELPSVSGCVTKVHLAPDRYTNRC